MTSPRVLLRAWELKPRKQLGQNFLEDPTVSEMIVRSSNVLADDTVLEIGAGLGALTIPLARAAKKVYAVEKDQRVSKLLKNELLASNLSNVELLEEDILRVDINALAETTRSKIVVIGNLPYNISSQILIKLMNSRRAVDRAILMFQRELAERLTAQVGNKDYGRITVMLQYCSRIRPVADVPAGVFHPRPRVDSKVVEVSFYEIPRFAARDEAFLFRVIKAAFGKRRKTLKNALTKSQLSIDTQAVIKALNASGIDPVRRAETLSVQEFVTLSHHLGAEP